MGVHYGDPEQLVKAWLKTTPVAATVPLPGNLGPAIFNAMPKAAPNPALLIELIGGGPLSRADLPAAQYRLSFDAFGRTRAEAAAITYALVEALENLGRESTYTDGATTLYTASVVLVRWLPDPDSDTPRYVVDALVTTLT